MAKATATAKRKKAYVSKTGLSRDQWRRVFAEAAKACGPTIGQCMRTQLAAVRRKYGI